MRVEVWDVGCGLSGAFVHVERGHEWSGRADLECPAGHVSVYSYRRR